MIEPTTASTVAYFSMEIALDPSIPTYSGGLGVLAGDSLRAAADLRLPLVAVTLVSRAGYFRQQLDAEGHQSESPDPWTPEDHLTEMPERVTVAIEGRAVHLRAWQFLSRGCPGNEFASAIPVYLLDSDLPENDEPDRRLTHELYGGDQQYRLSQETVLGLGGVALLRALGYRNIQTYHLNEGHSGLLALALLEEQLDGVADDAVSPGDVDAVRRQCVFTVHTPVAAGHDIFPRDLVTRVLGEERTSLLDACGAFENDLFNMTSFVMSFSRSANGVSMRHGQVSRDMFPGRPVSAITNGVHAGTWIAPPLAQLFDKYLPGWRRDTRFLRYAMGIPLNEMESAHADARRDLVAVVAERAGANLDPNIMTIGFARRATGYKRGDLIFSDLGRLRRIVERAGPLQIVYSGKAHARDDAGKEIIQQVFAAARELQDVVTVTYLENYDMALARHLVSGVDLWLNNPQKPLEASGTSGMKAAMNGVPSLSVLDGWWIEGHVEGVTGWAIGDENPEGEDAEIASLYDKLEYAIMPLFYRQPLGYAAVMRYCIALNGQFFSAQRMMNQYNQDVYHSPGEGPA
jgi:starch phosphorylase